MRTRRLIKQLQEIFLFGTIVRLHWPRRKFCLTEILGKSKNTVKSCLISLCHLFLKLVYGFLRKTTATHWTAYECLGEREKLWISTDWEGSHKRSRMLVYQCNRWKNNYFLYLMHRQAIFCLCRPTTTTPMFMFIHKQLALIAILRKVQSPKAQTQDLESETTQGQR